MVTNIQRSAGHIWLAGDYAVNVSVWDEAWNTDFCTVNLSIIDNGLNSSRSQGSFETIKDLPVNAVDVKFESATQPEYPMTITTTSYRYLFTRCED